MCCVFLCRFDCGLIPLFYELLALTVPWRRLKVLGFVYHALMHFRHMLCVISHRQRTVRESNSQCNVTTVEGGEGGE